MKFYRHLAITRKLLVLNLIICGAALFVAIAALFSLQILTFRNSFLRDTATLAAVVANNSTAALAFKDANGAAEVVNSLRAKPTVVGALIVSADGSTLARFGGENDMPDPSHFPAPGGYRFGDGHLLYAVPIAEDGKRLGTLYLRSNYRKTLKELLGFYALMIGGVMLTSVLLAMFLSGKLGRGITLPVLQLAQTAQIVGENQDYSVRAPGGGQEDEMSRLTTAFNQMLSRIQAQDQALKESQERFEIAIAGANDGIWDWNLKTNEIFFSPKWKQIIGYSVEEIEDNYRSFESLLHPEDLGHMRAIQQDYLDGRRPVYEVEFRMRQKNGQYRWILSRGAALRDADNKPYRFAGSHTDIHGRKQAESEVRAAREKFETLVNSIDGIVWECDASTIAFTFVSPQSKRLLGFTPEEWLANPNFWQEHLHPEDAAEAIRTCRDMIARRRSYHYDYRMIAADGRTVWLRESGDVLLDQDGQPKLVRGIFQDITEQKKATAQLEQLNRQLIDISRQAGMAEVATGVLHNVGNVLNSVSVSATIVSDRLKRSRLSNLRRATAMLREQNGSLAQFLTTDSKGKVLPEYLSNVSDQLAADQSQILNEVALLSQNIEHIKEIVAMQQTYAKVSGAFERMSPTELLEDALRMNAAAFERHGVKVIRHYSPQLPLVNVDRHKVLQILINLIRNAKYAMEVGQPADKRFEVGVDPGPEGMVVIRLRDNGVGIAPENLARIFSHGFTTKKDGHGFGLHSGANAAKEIGGRLYVHSEGLGHGAEFTLELPTAEQETKFQK